MLEDTGAAVQKLKRDLRRERRLADRLLIMMAVMLLITTVMMFKTAAAVDSMNVLEERMERLHQEMIDTKARLEEFTAHWDIAIFETTAYSSLDDRNGLNSQGDPSETASGTTVHPGTIAVDPEKIAYGSRVWVQGEGWCTAEDTGAAIKSENDGWRIDVWKETFPEAMAHGRSSRIAIWEVL